MTTNMGLTDRSLRLVIAVIAIALYFFHVITGALGVIILVIAAIFIVTSFFGRCPLYTICRINTKPKRS